MLCEDDTPTVAWAPVGILYMHTLQDREERASKRELLKELAEHEPAVAKVLRVAGILDDQDPVDGSPTGVIATLVEGGLPLQPMFARLLDSSEGGDDSAVEAKDWIEADKVYQAGDLGAARYALERALLRDGDQPDVVRNLLAIASEQRDTNAYLRYWQRYVRLLLWHLIRADHDDRARLELIAFYDRVATVTDREFEVPREKVGDILRTPGLLARWLEAHTALAWLSIPDVSSSAAASSSAVRNELSRFWLSVFHPDVERFASHPDLDMAAISTAGRLESGLAFDPVEQIVKRFAQWSHVSFGLTGADADDDETVSALAAFVSRLPLRVYASLMQEAFSKDKLDAKDFRNSVRDACSLGIRARLSAFLDEKNHAGLVHFILPAGSLGHLQPDLQLWLAYALCDCERAYEAMAQIEMAVPLLDGEDLDNERSSYQLVLFVVRANADAAGKLAGEARKARFSELHQVVSGFPESAPFEPLRRECTVALMMSGVVDEAIGKSKKLVADGKFDEARKMLGDLPEELRELRENLIRQVDEAQAQRDLNEQIDELIELSNGLVAEGDFDGAADIIRDFPDESRDLSELKEKLLGRIAEARREARDAQIVNTAFKEVQAAVNKDDFAVAYSAIKKIPERTEQLRKRKKDMKAQIANVEKQKKRIDQAIKECQKLVGVGKFEQARSKIRALQGADLEEVRSRSLSQIDEAENSARDQEKIEGFIKKAKKLVAKGDFDGAKRAVNSIPKKSEELIELKTNLLSQIAEVAKQAQEATRENSRLFNELERKGISAAVIAKIATDNNVDPENAAQFNSLLKAIKEQL